MVKIYKFLCFLNYFAHATDRYVNGVYTANGEIKRPKDLSDVMLKRDGR